MTYIPLLTIPILFLVFALLSSRVKKGAWFRPCAICASVSLTWLFLLIFFWDQVRENPTAVAALMGMSVAGLMFKIVASYEKRHLRHLWAARLIIILGGFATIIFLLGGQFGPMLLSLIVTLLLLAVVSFLLQGTTHAQAVESSGHTSISKKLDNCC
ncbi:MAG: hypothetical protein AAB413_05275 [Patescibacteria group bacterium]